MVWDFADGDDSTDYGRTAPHDCASDRIDSRPSECYRPPRGGLRALRWAANTRTTSAGDYQSARPLHHTDSSGTKPMASTSSAQSMGVRPACIRVLVGNVSSLPK